MSEYILIRVKRPEDSEDVIPEILAEDFIATAQYGQWEWEAWDEPKCGACGGTGWVTRDPDIGTDQECPACKD